MSLRNLRERIQSKTAKLAVIGLGYVGLPVACEFARTGFDVVGVDVQDARIQTINRGISPIEGNEPGLAELLGRVIASGCLRATTDYSALRDRDAIFIDVETPVDENNIPRYRALKAALTSLGPVLKEGALVVIESTIAPGTMQEVVLPLLEKSSSRKLNDGFYLGNCPERVMPGKLLNNLRTLSRVAGGMTPDTADTMVALYKNVVDADVDPTDCVTAELVKTVENAYRDVQIAFANEVALICEAIGGDVWKVRELVNKSPFRQMHLPGAGVGGHCIPKDPWLLAYGAEQRGLALQLIPAARAVNDSMPLHVVDLLTDALREAGKDLPGSRVLVMGYAYLEDSDDTRNSPSEKLVNRLKELGIEIVIHDPYLSGYQGDIFVMAKGCDAAVVMVRHSQYKQMDLVSLQESMRTPVIVDGRNILSGSRTNNSGWIVRKIGMRD